MACGAADAAERDEFAPLVFRVAPSKPQQQVEPLAQPAFEEMAVPEPVTKPLARTTPLPLIPRNLDASAAALPSPRSEPATFRTAPRTVQPPLPPKAARSPASIVEPAVPKASSEVGSIIPGKLVQLGAFRSRVEAEKALANWKSQVPGAFAHVAAPAIVTVDLGEKGTFYRVRVPGFADSGKASEFCGEYKGPGRDCYVVP